MDIEGASPAPHNFWRTLKAKGVVKLGKTPPTLSPLENFIRDTRRGVPNHAFSASWKTLLAALRTTSSRNKGMGSVGTGIVSFILAVPVASLTPRISSGVELFTLL